MLFSGSAEPRQTCACLPSARAHLGLPPPAPPDPGDKPRIVSMDLINDNTAPPPATHPAARLPAPPPGQSLPVLRVALPQTQSRPLTSREKEPAYATASPSPPPPAVLRWRFGQRWATSVGCSIAQPPLPPSLPLGLEVQDGDTGGWSLTAQVVRGVLDTFSQTQPPSTRLLPGKGQKRDEVQPGPALVPTPQSNQRAGPGAQGAVGPQGLQ